MDLNQDFLRYQEVGDTKYYGYAYEPSTTDSQKKWSIRAVVGTNSVTVKWNINSRTSYTSIWNNKADHFTTPGTASLGITHSVGRLLSLVPPPYRRNPLDPTFVEITPPAPIYSISMIITWSDISGVDKYRIKIKDHNGITYNGENNPFMNPHSLVPNYTSETSDTKYHFVGITGMTYSIDITSLNQSGSSTVGYTHTT